MSPATPRRLLLIGGGGGLVGRAVLEEFAPGWSIRSVHRHHAAEEEALGVEWVPRDVRDVTDWANLLAGVDVVVNLAWYRWGSPQQFSTLRAGLERAVQAATASRGVRFVHVSVPPAPDSLERTLPYLVEKRAFDRYLTESGLSYAIVRPTMLFGPGDRLLGVMLRLMDRYPWFPMFGDGGYHVSPLAVTDLARILHAQADGVANGTLDVGGPVRYRYRELTDLMFAALHKDPRYWGLTPWGARRLAAVMQSLGSTLLYEYEVEWLLSDLLGLPPPPQWRDTLQRVEPYLTVEARRWRADPVPGGG